MRLTVGRLKRRSEFLRVARARRSIATRGLVLQACRRPAGEEGIRVGFTASKKVGGAVQRNRARRRLKAAVDSVLPLHALRDHDYVVIARAATAGRPFQDLLLDLSSALKRLDLWREA